MFPALPILLAMLSTLTRGRLSLQLAPVRDRTGSRTVITLELLDILTIAVSRAPRRGQRKIDPEHHMAIVVTLGQFTC